MVKIKFKIIKNIVNSKRRIRGIKSNKNREKQKNSLEEKINNLDSSKIIEQRNIKFKPEDRIFILVGLYELIEIKSQKILFPDNFIFSVITLFDFYIRKSEKYLSRKEMVKILYACLSLISKHQNINIFNEFKDYFDNELEIDIFEAVDYEIYPEKIYDYFDDFYHQTYQKLLNNNKLLNYLNEFKNIFLNSSFFLLFDLDSLNNRTINNYKNCLYYSYKKLSELIPVEDNYLEIYKSIFIDENKYSENEYFSFECIIKKSYSTFNHVYKECINRKSKK